MTTTIQHTQETLCLAHIYAVAGMAGVNHGLSRVHDYGVDGQFDGVIVREARRVESGHSLAFQAKSTVNWEIKNGFVVYDLETKTYNDLVSRSVAAITMLLILLCLPKDRLVWHEATPNGTMLRNCCYWHLLRGELCNSATTKRIFIPVENLLTAKSLKELMAAEEIRREALWL